MNFSVDLNGRVAAVTGAAGGIGGAIAKEFARSGAQLVITDTKERADVLKEVAAEITNAGGRVLMSPANITDRGEVDQLLGDVLNEFGGVDLLVNVAGVYLTDPISSYNESAWDKTMSVNVKGPFLSCQSFSKVMCKQGHGVIINVASDSAIDVANGDGPYGASKSALVALTRHIAREQGRYGVRANAIAPGWVKTEMTRFVWSEASVLKDAEKSIPLGYLAEPKDIADVALFLASDASRYVSGQLIVANGARI